ncbi:hypothetical protein P3W23_12955 [Luteibacter sp. PPL554]
MDFFAMVGGQQLGVYRIELHQDLQQQLTEAFRLQGAQFLDEAMEVVPFERENFHPDDSEVLEISPFDLPELIFNATLNPAGWQTLPINDETLERIYCVFGYDANENALVFQVIQRAQRLSRHGFNLLLAGNAFTRLDAPGLVLSDGCHAVFKDGALRFRSMWKLKQIIDISGYYRAATAADIEELAALDNVVIEDREALDQRAGPWVRTRVAYIMDSEILKNFTVSALVQKAGEFNVDLDIVDDDGTQKLLIPQEPKKLRSLLKFLEEEYYAGPITGAAYEANSKRRR